jgi:pimeloyl-ACP methyl ester carboxylesterase
MRRPGHARAFRATTRTSHAPAEARLSEIASPTLVVMGERDPDFSDPLVEARLISERLDAEVLVVPHAGHYPHVEYPEQVNPALVGFVERVARRG